MQANKVKALSARLEGMKTHMKPKEVKVKIPKEKKKKRSQRVSAPSLLDLPTVLTPSLGNTLVPQISGSKASAKA